MFGINIEKSYPFEGRDGKCHFNSASVGATSTGLVRFPSPPPPNIKLWTIFMIVHRVADWFVFDSFLHLEKNVFIKNTTPTQTITVMLMF